MLVYRLNKEFASGLIDISIGFTKKGGQNLFQYSCHHNIFVAIEKSGITNIRNKRVGFVNAGVYKRIYGNKFNTVNTYINSDESLFKMLIAGRIDGFFISNVVLDAYIKFGVPRAILPEQWQQSILDPVIISSSPVYFQVSQKSDIPYSALNKIQTSAELHSQKGVFDEIYQNYGVQNKNLNQNSLHNVV
ncbi:MAG: hypothetical protein HRU38_25005 [Saccharospirillaceae bacterium]|nr:transporter substrate-binding domain-containing protein [Pseudomonadales bacterium]NRB81876.1 hypothetical protein [Saccharospirillaceae bacterium]